jgi:malate dehydrogenase (oxaloacetate-decarboxylating)(NADP+)
LLQSKKSFYFAYKLIDMKDKMSRDALAYHEKGKPGKIEVVPTKPHSTQRDLSLAYSPGVAAPCLAIEKNPPDAYRYTSKGNLVGVISNGTAVLGLGDIGALAGKPVMEGKGLLFKIYADVDVFDIEVDEKDVEKFITAVKAIAPTFGGINLEDIKAPECFEIEERLKAELKIPVMHDDQHGTAIISSAALLNALQLTDKKIDEVKVVVNGAGAAAMTCAKLYMHLGVKDENLIMLDSKGVIHRERKDLNKYKIPFAIDEPVYTLEEAIVGADVFLGLSVAGVLTQEMLRTMADNPIVFALANPDPEITYDDALAARDDVIMGTGRSDYPNQINNVLGFPYIFRGALDVAATDINMEMKLAAVQALADLARLPVPEEVNIAFHIKNLSFGTEYLIPKPTDPRLIEYVATAVAKAAMDSGVAQKPIKNFQKYKEELRKRMGIGTPLMRQIKNRAKRNKKRVILSDSDNYKMLKAAEIVLSEGLAVPVLLGDPLKIKTIIEANELQLPQVEIIDPKSKEERERREFFIREYWEKRRRKGVTLSTARDAMLHRNYYGVMLLQHGAADAFVSGVNRNYNDTLRPALQIIGKKEGVNIVSGMYIVNTKEGPMFFADCTVNKDPSIENLIEITMQTAHAIRQFNITPRIAFVSYSNFGSNKGIIPEKQRMVVERLHKEYPNLIVDGEMQANVALDEELLKGEFSFSRLKGKKANTLIFPSLTSANIAYKLVQRFGDYDVVGPIISGMKKPVHVLSLGASVEEIVNMVMIAVLDAQTLEK